METRTNISNNLKYIKADKNLTLEKVGDNLKKIRSEKKITQQSLADNFGCGQSYISLLEGGDVDIQICTIVDLAKALGVTTNEILKGI